MKRRTLLTGAAAALAATPLARPHAQKPVTISWWYHFDDPKATPDELVAAFEKENPGIKIERREHPLGWRRRLRQPALHLPHRRQRAGHGDGEVQQHAAPDGDGCADAARQMDRCAGREAATFPTDLWRLHTAPDGKRYYMPLQYVVMYLYVRLDLLAKMNLKPPTNFDEFLAAAKATDRQANNGASVCAVAPAGMIAGCRSRSAPARSW